MLIPFSVPVTATSMMPPTAMVAAPSAYVMSVPQMAPFQIPCDVSQPVGIVGILFLSMRFSLPVSTLVFFCGISINITYYLVSASPTPCAHHRSARRLLTPNQQRLLHGSLLLLHFKKWTTFACSGWLFLQCQFHLGVSCQKETIKQNKKVHFVKLANHDSDCPERRFIN